MTLATVGAMFGAKTSFEEFHPFEREERNHRMSFADWVRFNRPVKATGDTQ